MSQVKPWQVWWVELDPTQGREQAGLRPAVVVSSPFHLSITRGLLVSVLPLTTRQRPGWLHHVEVASGKREASFVITEQIRSVSTERLRRVAWTLTPEEIAQVRRVLAKMIDLV